MASPEWNQGGASASSFGRKHRAITPSNSDLDPIAKTVVMCATGDITVMPVDSSTTIAFSAVPAGWVVPFVVRRVTACTSTCVAIDG